MKFSTLLKPILAGACALSALAWQAPANAVPVNWNGWTFDYEVGGAYKEGLILKNVKYQTHTLLKKASLPIIYHFGFDSRGASCSISPDKLDATLSPMPWANNATLSQRQFSFEGRQWYEIGIYKKISTTEYYQAYYLSTDGIFDAHLYVRGNACNNYDHASSRAYWRLDTDVDGAENDLMEGYIRYKDKLLTPIVTEQSGGISRLGIRDLTTNNIVNLFKSFNNFSHPDGNTTIDPYISGPLSPTVFQELLYRPNEDIGWTSSTYLTPYANGENINGKDVLTWHQGDIPFFGDTKWNANGIALVPSWVPKQAPDLVYEYYPLYGANDLASNGIYTSNGTFYALIRNRGITPTPADKTIAVGFYDNGIYKTWATFPSGDPNWLAPGEARLAYTTDITRYPLPNGDHTLTAFVDNVNRIAELDETNNKYSTSISRSGPDVTPPYVAITSPTQGSLVSGSTVVISVKAFDNVALKNVQIILEDVNYGTQTVLLTKKVAPFVFSWDSTTVSQGIYHLKAIATDTAGNVYEHWIAISVDTPATIQKPDLVVTNATYANGQFTCTIKNAGTAEIPAAALMTLGFYVDGAFANWTSGYGPLAAGASVTLQSKGAAYTVPTGSHTLKAHIDNMSLIMEGNETNNVLTKTITVP